MDEDALRGHGLEDALAVEALMGWDDPPLRCAACGAELVGMDPDDDPDGDARLPICGECNRAGASMSSQEKADGFPGMLAPRMGARIGVLPRAAHGTSLDG